MTPRLPFALALALAALAGLPAAAQEVDCDNAMDQNSMNMCAEQDWQRADADLNDAYQAAMALLTEWDSGLPEELQGGPDALKEGQRAWITYRDKSCEAEGYAMRGGSAEPLLVYGCMARLSDMRAADLWAMVETGGDY